jgi:hypothetical protein
MAQSLYNAVDNSLIMVTIPSYSQLSEYGESLIL